MGKSNDKRNEYALLVPHLNIGSEQYKELCNTAKKSIPSDLKQGLQTAFYNGLLEKLDSLHISDEIIIIRD
jgi:hypothetical protein